MKINYDRVAELLQSTVFRQTVKDFLVLDIRKKLAGGQAGAVVIYVADMICSGRPPEDTSGPSRPMDEYIEFIKVKLNAEYVTEIIMRVVDELKEDLRAKHGKF